MKIEPHDVETAAVGDLLVKHGIPYAVMNACRSAKGSSVDSNIALQLVQSGLRGCAAMSANIVGNSVQTFTLSFYTKTSCFMVSLSNGQAQRPGTDCAKDFRDQRDLDRPLTLTTLWCP